MINQFKNNGHFAKLIICSCRIFPICIWEYRRLHFGAFILILLSGSLAACADNQTTPPVNPPIIDASTVKASDTTKVESTEILTPTAIATAVPTQIPDTGWISLKTGLERRVINLKNEKGVYIENLYLLRIDRIHR